MPTEARSECRESGARGRTAAWLGTREILVNSRCSVPSPAAALMEEHMKAKLVVALAAFAGALMGALCGGL